MFSPPSASGPELKGAEPFLGKASPNPRLCLPAASQRRPLLRDGMG